MPPDDARAAHATRAGLKAPSDSGARLGAGFLESYKNKLGADLEMRTMKMAGMVRALGVTLAVGLLAGPVVAQDLSEKSVKTFMDYAWNSTPAQFTTPRGDLIQIDKKKRDEVMVPIDVAREVIKVGRLSSHAQVCELKPEQVANYHSLMYREEERKDGEKKKWTPQQLIYINQLHLTTVMLLTGKIKLVEKDGDKEVVVEESKTNNQTCSAEQRAKVKEMVKTYVYAGPKAAQDELAAAASAPSAPAAAAAAAAAAAPPKK